MVKSVEKLKKKIKKIHEKNMKKYCFTSIELLVAVLMLIAGVVLVIYYMTGTIDFFVSSTVI